MSMFPIASYTVTGSAATYAAVFNSIPQTFTHLQLRVFGRGTQAQINNYNLLQFNNDTAVANYRAHWLQGDGASATSGADASASTFLLTNYMTGANAAANNFGVSIIDILDYTSTTKTKVTRGIGGFDNNGSGTISLYSGVWFISPIAAITQLSLFMANAAVGTRVDLYGISTSGVTGA